MASSRASDVLDSLMGRDDFGDSPKRRRTLFSREAEPDGGRSPSSVSKSRPVVLLGVALAVAACVPAAIAWQSVKRPLPIEDRMPVAGEGSVELASGSEPNTSKSLTGAGESPNGGSQPGHGDAASSAGSETKGTKVVVHVTGAVVSPGVVSLSAGSRVVDAVTAAGGLRPDADPDRVNLAALLSDGVRVAVPVVGEPLAPELAAVQGQPTGGGGGGKPQPAAPVNINLATADELEQLPGVGPATAAAIVTKREKDGPFESVESLLDVRGIGDAKLEGLRDLVTVG
ncbi:MAG TPA: ComEA family DNA-binding protein [Microthrixaceae bacterium]|nr:ComEA family DNA-binding protein [Microthrixaceae bacterium]